MLAAIGLFKLTKGTLLVALALELLRVGQAALGGSLAQWSTRLHIDPDGGYLGPALQAIAARDWRQLELARAGLFVYGALFLTEGTGLVLRKRWAEYFTVIATGSLIPLDAYEIVRRPDRLRITACLVNEAIVCYLARGIRPRTR